MPAQPKARRTFRILVRCALAAAAALAVWCLILYAVILTYHGKSEAELRHADVGIVLGASLWNDRPSPALAERLDYAMKLYRDGLFDRFLVTGGLDRGGVKLTEAEGMRDYLLARGVPPDAIVLENKARSTYENLRFSRDIMKENGWRTAVIVTHRFHGSRSADIARTLGYDPVQVSVTESKVMNLVYYRAREVLAYTKWLAEKGLLHVGSSA